MATWIQGIKLEELLDKGWTIDPAPPTTTETPIGGPVDVTSPEGIKYRVMSDGTLEKKAAIAQ